ncbi:hypothetical protein HX021_03060 [Sphingobacterium sp. N143]|uniref:hypothetical protein n=1 Tax=Sphingobacterium sp. N143 TaxID=2746727 RepID=UPI0025756E20|nr:hypothetical protein [Sphingobacterium sp. N143]MDM1293271.1 hypothetical protein [Sphingobacterium sp. N143]
MQHKRIFLSSLLISNILLGACNNQTPQEKATRQMEKAEELAAKANEEAMSTSERAAAKNTDAVVYANIAAANEAVSKIPAPILSNQEAKKIYSKLGRTIVDRINVKTAKEAIDKEQAIIAIKNDIISKLQQGKITQTDRNNMLKYLQDCIAAAESTI